MLSVAAQTFVLVIQVTHWTGWQLCGRLPLWVPEWCLCRYCSSSLCLICGLLHQIPFPCNCDLETHFACAWLSTSMNHSTSSPSTLTNYQESDFSVLFTTESETHGLPSIFITHQQRIVSPFNLKTDQHFWADICIQVQVLFVVIFVSEIIGYITFLCLNIKCHSSTELFWGVLWSCDTPNIAL
jgi:hypothetical protein